jgi:hypothetical protein
MDHLTNAAEMHGVKAGRVIVLPSSFPGSPRAMQQHYQDAMSIVRKYGKPDLFLTFTCNPKWKEIEEQLFPGQTPSDRPDLVSRVFKLKLDELIVDLLKKHVLGRAVSHIFVIEFQKRGLPHCHMLIILASEDKPHDSTSIDRIVSSEIPDSSRSPRLFELVKRHMIHGPCGIINKNSPCMEDGKCSKGFPKEFHDETTANKDGYPRYARRSTGVTVRVGKYEVDNRWVVPYNPYLLMKYNAHINVEVCATVKSIKYLFKYVYKGHDCAKLRLVRPIQQDVSTAKTLEWDEIKTYLDARYVSAPEASWRLFEFPLHDKSHSIIRLAVHLPNLQPVYFSEGNEQNALQRAATKDTTLTAWFQLNRQDPDARQYLYHDIPQHFVFDRYGQWKRRQQGDKIIGRMYSVSPNDVERYHLRILLLNTPGARSYDDLKIVDNEVCPTFTNAAKRRGLLHDDTEYVKCMDEAATFQMPQQLRMLFCMILIHCNPTDPIDLWNSFKAHMAEDFLNSTDADTAEAMAFHAIESKMNEQGRSCTDFGIPKPSIVCPSELEMIDREEELRIGERMYQMLNEGQRTAANQIVAAYQNQSTAGTSCFFIDGPGGTGKTYLYNTLFHLLKGRGIGVMTVAWTGIAANLLPEGRTVHSRFKLPVPLIETSTSSMRCNSKEAETIRKSDVFIWDEAPMAPSYALKAVDMLLRDLMNISTPFGGKIMVLGGDFRQVLPVIRFANKSQLIAASLKSSELWSHFQMIHLHQNMRTGPGEVEFSQWLIKLGNGELPFDNHDRIELPSSCLSNDDLVNEIFSKEVSLEDTPSLCNRVILSPKNEDSLSMNEDVLQRLTGQLMSYKSVDQVECEDGEDISNYPTEFLNSLTPSGMPPHHLNLKIGAIVMLLRNLDIHQGLCNGTRLTVRRLQNHTIDCEVISGSTKGHRVLIPRITLTPSDVMSPFKLRRRQFPVRLSFAMTINKAQGQTFDRLGLFLPQPVFSHGQLYVAFSRVRSLASIKVRIIETRDDTKTDRTKNIVFKEIL